MTKRRPPNSPERALMESILALDPAPSVHDHDAVVADWERAAELTGRSVKQLYQTTNPDQHQNSTRERSRTAPIYLRDIEAIDLANMRAGKPGYNSEALSKRLEAKLEGMELPAPQAESHLRRATIEIRSALDIMQDGQCDTHAVHEYLILLHRLVGDLMDEWHERERVARNRRKEDRKPPGDHEHPKSRPQLRAVGQDK